MALRLREVSLELEEDEILLAGRVADILKIEVGDVAALTVVRRSFDARRKPRVLRVYTVEFTVPDEEALLSRWRLGGRLEKIASPSPPRPASLLKTPSCPGCRHGSGGTLCRLETRASGDSGDPAGAGGPG